MSGFFNKMETRNKPQFVKGCSDCGLYLHCKSPKMNYTGQGKLGVLLVAEAPGAQEDEQGIQLIGKSGQYLRSILSEFDLDLERDFWKTNAVCCRPKGNKTPTDKEIKCCYPRLLNTIKELKPKFIIAIGSVALKALLPHNFKASISQWRGLIWKDQNYNAHMGAIYHPAYVLRKQHDQNLLSVFYHDIITMVTFIKNERPVFENYENNIIKLTSFDIIQKQLRQLLKEADIGDEIKIAFDIETSGLQPYTKGHKIYSIGYRKNDDQNSYAHPISYPNCFSKTEEAQIKLLWKKIIEHENIFKIIHNLKFEYVWAKIILKAKPKNMSFCTMNMAHIIDERQGFCGLKKQVYLNFGISNYDAEAKKYISSISNSEFNLMHKMPLDRQLLYVGYDAFYTMELYKKQMNALVDDDPRYQAYLNFTQPGLIALAESESQGINIDLDYYKKQFELLSNDVVRLLEQLRQTKEAKDFKKKKNRYPNFRSALDIKYILYNILKCEVTKKTTKDQESVDNEVLVALGTDFAHKLIALRHKLKIKDTYLRHYIEKQKNGKIYPFIDLHIARSFRSNSQSPNIQNVPVRNEEAKKICREGIIPSKGNKLLCADYGSHEVRILACITKDPVLVKELHDGLDMHKAQAVHLFNISESNITSKMRKAAKSFFVFPQIYGSYHVSCAKNLYDECFDDLKTNDGLTIREHLEKEKIISRDRDRIALYEYFNGESEYLSQQLIDFIAHVKKVETAFWEKYHVTKQFQNSLLNNYRNNGFVEMITGFRRSGYLSKNEISNTPIQGPAFHCLLWAYAQVEQFIKEKNLKSRLIFEVHDELVVDLVPEEEPLLRQYIKLVMEYRIRQKFDWINVPLICEIETTDINESWYHKK